jgi:hypothetical protein
VVRSAPALCTKARVSAAEAVSWILRPAILSSEAAMIFTGAKAGSDSKSKAWVPRISKADSVTDSTCELSAKSSSHSLSKGI